MSQGSPLSRLAAGLLLLLLLWQVWADFTMPLAKTIDSDRKQIRLLHHQLARFAEVAAAASSPMHQSESRQARETSEKLFLTGTGVALAGAEFQRRTQHLAQQADLSVLRSRSFQVRPEGGLQGIGLELEVAGSSAGLMRLLYSLEDGAPPVFVERLNMVTTDRQASPPAADGQPIIAAGLRVIGYIRSDLTQEPSPDKH